MPPQPELDLPGPFGKFDRAQLQRGFKVYREVCASCHGLSYVAFRNLAEPGGPEFSEAQVTRARGRIQDPGRPERAGRHVRAPRPPGGPLPVAVPERERGRGREWRQGAAGPLAHGEGPHLRARLPLVRLRRRSGSIRRTAPDYLVALLNGYEEPPQGFTVPEGGHYNEYYPGHVIAMPKPLSDGQVEYPKAENGQPQAPETVDQYARDVTAFLAWTAEPHLEARKRIGFQVMLFLIVLAVLLYFTKKKIWARVGGEVEGYATPPMTHNP